MDSRFRLTAHIEPFDSFWEAPDDIAKGYGSFYKFYRHNYLAHLPDDRNARVLVVSCGPGYFVNMLSCHGYTNVLGIDSSSEKVRHARERNLNCRVDRVHDFLEDNQDPYDVIVCEQEINHLTKGEILAFLTLVRRNLRRGGMLILHSLNGANPVTGSEALAQNFDHFNTFTEYTMRQVLAHTGFTDIKIIPLKLYVFHLNPLNYLLMALSALYTCLFRFSFMLYGKKNRVFTKKIGAVCRKA